MQNYRSAAVLILILIVSRSCGPFVSSGPSVQDAVPTTTATPPATEPPTPTLPPFTSTPLSVTDIPYPTGVNATGPYVLYGGQGGIWISNPDGSFLTKLTGLGIEGWVDLHRLVSPTGDRMALMVRNAEGLDLVEVGIPGGEEKTIAHLLSITNDELVSYPTSDQAIASYAIYDYDNIAWQPGEGKLLAFMGAMNGPTSDLYVYDIESGEVTQLTSGLTQAVFPNWSPNGEYILHYGVSWNGPWGGAILGHDLINSVWAVRVSDGEIINLPAPKSIALNFVGWQDDTHYITYDGQDTCTSRKLRSVDVATGKATPILDSNFYPAIARSSQNGALLFSAAADCPDSAGGGIFLLLPGKTTPTELTFQMAWEMTWMPESGVFNAYPVALFSADGSIRYDPPVYDKSYHPAVSQKGYQAWEVIENQQGRVEVKVPFADWQPVLYGSVADLIWDPVSGVTLLILAQDGSLWATSYPSFLTKKRGEFDNAGQVSQAISVP